jgi:esterase/lipase superfamily enzyme
MHREHHHWYSRSLERDMQLLVFGHGGARLLVFPTSQGRFYEWEDRGMVEAFRYELERGWYQFVCVDSVDAESWYAYWKHPADRARRHDQYDRYLLHEVLPFSWHINQTPFLMTSGASFGAYHAVNFALRHPHVIGRTIGLSGMYDIHRFADGYYDDVVYLHNPVDYVANEHDPGRLHALRRMDIILATGHDDPLRWQHDRMSHILWSKGIWHANRIWDGWSHDWPYWQRMLRQYIGGSD